MIFVLLGAPGAGKGTQASLLAANNDILCKISTGDSLRKHVKNKTAIGKKIEEVMTSGKLVSDDILLEVLKCELAECSGKSVILDGYPRNIEQAQTLSNMLNSDSKQKLAKVLLLNVEKTDLINRISGRRVCSGCGATYHIDVSPSQKNGICDGCQGDLVQRSDDSKDKIAVRLDVYENETKPLVDYYKKLGVLEVIDGSQSSDKVYESLQKSLGLVA